MNVDKLLMHGFNTGKPSLADDSPCTGSTATHPATYTDPDRGSIVKKQRLAIFRKPLLPDKRTRRGKGKMPNHSPLTAVMYPTALQNPGHAHLLNL